MPRIAEIRLKWPDNTDRTMAARNTVRFVLAILLISAVPNATLASDTADGRLLALINDYRSARGIGPLAADATLARVAERHGEDMASRGYFAHVTPEGGDLGHRLWNAGYRFIVAAENLARGYRAATAVLEGWRGSACHRANLLRDDVSHAGIAVVGSGDATADRHAAGPVWVLVVARPQTR